MKDNERLFSDPAMGVVCICQSPVAWFDFISQGVSELSGVLTFI